MEEAGAAQVSGDLHKAQRFGIKAVLLVLPSQTMAGENETSLQRKEPRRTPQRASLFGSPAKICQEQQQFLDWRRPGQRELRSSEEAGLLDGPLEENRAGISLSIERERIAGWGRR